MSSAPGTVSISLVSHTNAGKTTLARTLLGRDVGEVRDAPHVTEFADAHVLVETSRGDRLVLWDTPGFGDSVRLVRRLRQAEHPIGRFLSEAWDRWKDRPFWASQQAMRNTRDEADVLLYLVNASEQVEAAGYVQPEMELLGWIGKPVVVLLNQLGAPRAGDVEAAEVARWRASVSTHAHVRAVLPLDAFARCWVQELTLLAAVEDALPPAKRPAMVRLREAWRARRVATFDAAIDAIAASLARIATMSETVADAGGGVRARLRQAGAAIGLGSAERGPAALAQSSLATRLDDEIRANTRELLALHGLGGAAEGAIRDRLAAGYDLRLRLDETQAAMWGGAITGALVGLKADLLSGGLTLGGGLIAGGVLGALGSAGLARCVNLVRGTDRSFVTWNAAALDTMVEAALLRLLAVEHFGRGRGDWVEGEAPPHWAGVVAAALAPLREALDAAWSERAPAAAADPAALAARLAPIVGAAARASLRELYPDAGRIWPAEPAEEPTDERTDERTDEHTDERTDERRADEPTVAERGAVRALVFDVFGTVVDWRGSIVREGEAMSAAKGWRVDWPAFADAWRAGYQPSMQRAMRAAASDPAAWLKLDVLHRATLDELLGRFGLDRLSAAERDHLNLVWHRLDPWPDAVAGLTRLKARGPIATLSNGNVSLLVDMARHAGLPWDCVLSAELFRKYKPDPGVYLGAADLLGVAPGELLMVAAHPSDLAAAARAGLKTAYVDRPLERGPEGPREDPAGQRFDWVARDFVDLAAQLGA